MDDGFIQHALKVMNEIKIHIKNRFSPQTDVDMKCFEEKNDHLRFEFDSLFFFETLGKKKERMGDKIHLSVNPDFPDKVIVTGVAFEYPKQIDKILQRIDDLKRRQ